MTAAQMAQLFDLYEIEGLELFAEGTKNLPRQLILDLTLAPCVGEIVRYQAVNLWNESDWFDEWAKPSFAKMPESDARTDVTNERLRHCRTSEAVLGEFLDFIGNAEVLQVLKHTASNSLNIMQSINLYVNLLT